MTPSRQSGLVWRYGAAGLLTLSSVAHGARAQEPADTAVLAPLVVTADRVPIPLEQVTSTVTVLDGDALRAQGVTTVADALRGVPGVSVVQSGSYGANTALFLRGGESDYVKVLVDGVPLNDPGGVVDLANLTTDGIERIEVVRGPGSVLYGSDAMSGIVQIFTRRGAERVRARGGIALGTYATRRGQANIVGRRGTFDFSLGGSSERTAGLYEFNSGHVNTTWTGAILASPDPRTTARASFRVVDAQFHYPTDGSGNLVDTNSFQQSDRLLGSLAIARGIRPWLDARLAIGINEGTVSTDDAPDSPADTVGYFAFASRQTVARHSADLQVNARLGDDVAVTAGAQAERQGETSQATTQSEFGASESGLDIARTDFGTFAHARANPLPNLWITAGMRLDLNDVFGTFVSYQIGGRYRTPVGMTVRSSFARGFKEPTFYEQFANTPFARGNPDLVPERTRSWEVALESQVLGEQFDADVAYFGERFQDLIQYTFVPPDPAAPSYYNVAAAVAHGLEATFSARPSVSTSVTATYTYLHTRVTNAGFDEGPGAGFVEGERLLRRPTHSITVNVSTALLDAARVSGAVRYVGDRADRDFNAFPAQPVRLDGYLAVNVATVVNLVRPGSGPGVVVRLKLENAFGATYQEVYGFPAPGRRGIVGAEIEW